MKKMTVKGLHVCLLLVVVGRLQGEYQEKHYNKINKVYIYKCI